MREMVFRMLRSMICLVMKRMAVLFMVLLIVGGCGAEHKPKLLRGSASCVPREGEGVIGKCTGRRFGTTQRGLTIQGRFVPDVSEFQGRPCWVCVKTHIPGAIVRVDDNRWTDEQFAYNWRELRRLKIWHAVYAFLRPGNCRGEADRAISLIDAQGGLDSGPLIGDAEVPLNYWCVLEFNRETEKRTGLPSVDYTAPGTWPGGPRGKAVLWVATYGNVPGCVSAWPCVSGRPRSVAWQLTDGVYGPLPHCIVGRLFCGDISLDQGLVRIGRASNVKLHERLIVAYKKRALLRVLLTRRRCRTKHPAPRYGRVCQYWLREGQQVNRAIKALHEKGVY